MLILLPPSETKRAGGSLDFDPAALAHHEQLGEARARVRSALEDLCRDADREAAAKRLGLGVKNRDELLRNLELSSAGAMPALDRYTGVLYDALGADALGDAERAWAARHVAVQSALFGVVAADDAIPAYRLSAGTSLPRLGTSLKQLWREAHEAVDWPDGLVLDLRSKDYAAHASLPRDRAAVLNVVSRGPGGETRALNHFNKAAKGDLVARLARSRAALASIDEVLDWAAGEGLEMTREPGERTLTLVTELGAPLRPAAARASQATR